jgi:Zn-dependent protease with chaperone function
MAFAARYQNGSVAAIRDVLCHEDMASSPPELVIADAASREEIDRWPLEACHALPARMMELRIGNRERTPGARLAVGGIEGLRRAGALLPGLARQQRRDGWREARILAVATGVLLAVIIAYLYGIPRLADRLVAYVPPEWETRIGAIAAGQIESMLTEGQGFVHCDTDPDSLANRAIARFTAEAFEGLGSPFAPHVSVVRSDIANAFALPGGQTYYLSSLIQASRTPDEFAGVLAHELGHIHHRHGMETLIATSSTGLLVGFVLGDLTGLSVAGAVGASLIDTRFSRVAEAQADDFAGQTALRLGFAPAGLVDLLERIAGDDEFSRALALFSNHPLTDERRRALEALDSGGAATRPAFSAEEWRAIKDMCPPAAPPPLPAFFTTGAG